jgi:hypothetical protein
MSHIKLHMPECGEAGVIVATRDDGVRVEFRGNPYHAWTVDEDTPMFRLHCLLKRVNISQLHCGEVEIVTPWHPEWEEVNAMFCAALRGGQHEL